LIEYSLHRRFITTLSLAISKPFLSAEEILLQSGVVSGGIAGVVRANAPACARE
jgi:hypothetical protein